MFLEPIESAQVIDATNKLKPKFSSGHDDIYLQNIVNQSFQIDVYSSITNATKNSQSHPNLKNSDNTLINNYDKQNGSRHFQK